MCEGKEEGREKRMKVGSLSVGIERVGVWKAKAIEQTSCQLHRMILGLDELPKSGQSKIIHNSFFGKALFTSVCSAFRFLFSTAFVLGSGIKHYEKFT